MRRDVSRIVTYAKCFYVILSGTRRLSLLNYPSASIIALSVKYLELQINCVLLLKVLSVDTNFIDGRWTHRSCRRDNLQGSATSD